MAKQAVFPSTSPGYIEFVGREGDEAPDTPRRIDWRHIPVVLWNRDMDVQIGIVREDDVDGMNEDALWTGILDRTQINQLIALLRRARDAAYGKDE